MGVIFMPKHQILKMLQCAHILSLSIHFHAGNVYCGAVLTVHVSIFLTNKQLKNMKKQHPQLGFTFITSLEVILLMVEFHWTTKIYVTFVNKNFHHMNLEIYTPEKIWWWWRQQFLNFIPVSTYQTSKSWPFTYHMCAYLVQITLVKCDAHPSNYVNCFKMFYVVVILFRG